MATAYILPWLELRDPIQLGSEFVLRPLEDACAHLPDDQSAKLRGICGSFYSRTAIEQAIRSLRYHLEGGEFEINLSLPEKLRPAVMITEDQDRSIARGRVALNALTFASMVESHEHNYTCSTTFQSFRSALLPGGNDGMVVNSQHTLYGRQLNLVDPAFAIEMRPPHASENYRPNPRPELISALIAGCAARSGGSEVARALEALSIALSYAPEITMEYQHSLFALAIELFAARPHRARWDDHLKSMFNPLFERRIGSNRRRRGRRASHLVAALRTIQGARNNFWHPELRKKANALTRQRLVTPLLIALQAVHALAIARLCQLGALDTSDPLVLDVYAITDWLAALRSRPDRNLTHPVELLPDRQAYASAMTEWNEAARRAANWQTLRGTERMRDRIMQELTRQRRGNRPLR